MTEQFYVGMVAGGGWGMFFGFILGALWVFAKIAEVGEEQGPDDKGREE